MNYHKTTNGLKNQNMLSKKLILSALIVNFVLLTSCGQINDSDNKVETTIKAEQIQKTKHKIDHQYGGWYCPDNLKGFPAVDIQELDKVPVVNGRLPTEEETRNGTSLMYFDTAKIPNARPLEMIMPKLARYYSTYTKKNELIVVIQAVVADKDTIVGFRYLNGGNGSARFDEVNFISDEEIDKLGSTPFISFKAEINASKEKIWEVIIDLTYVESKSVGKMFDENSSIKSDWKENSKVQFVYGPGAIAAIGTVTIRWENLYIQVDYNLDGYHYAEKILISENKDSNSTALHIVSGPYGENFEARKIVWENWLQKIKALSEGKR